VYLSDEASTGEPGGQGGAWSIEFPPPSFSVEKQMGELRCFPAGGELGQVGLYFV